MGYNADNYNEQGGKKKVISGEVDITGTLKKAGDEITASATEINNVADVSERIQEVTANETDIVEGKQFVGFKNDEVAAITATIADAKNHQGLFVVKDVSNDNTQDHILTLTSGTFDGTNDTATMDAAGEALVVYFDSNGNGVVVENINAVLLSSS